MNPPTSIFSAAPTADALAAFPSAQSSSTPSAGPPADPSAATITVGVVQRYTRPSLDETLDDLEQAVRKAQHAAVDLLLFPEAYLGGYPRTESFGATIGGRTDEGREKFLHYFKSCVDLGDTPRGAGDAWVNRTLPLSGESGSGSGTVSSGKVKTNGRRQRGDGTRERLEQLAAATGIFLVVGLVEKAGGSLYCSVVYVEPGRGCIGKRRKVMPTGTERVVWAQGQPSSLRAVTTRIKGRDITLAAAICWENYMPLLRQSLYSQNVNIYLAPTADARPTWLALMQTVACEGRAFVLSACQCQKYEHLPDWIRSKASESTDSGSNSAHQPAISPSAFACRGGSCIIAPDGSVLESPSWEKEEDLLVTKIDLDDCIRGRLDFDAAGSYSRSDAFELSVEGLDLNPPL